MVLCELGVSLLCRCGRAGTKPLSLCLPDFGLAFTASLACAALFVLLANVSPALVAAKCQIQKDAFIMGAARTARILPGGRDFSLYQRTCIIGLPTSNLPPTQYWTYLLATNTQCHHITQL